MNVASHQVKDKKKVKRKAREERKQATSFKEAGCCLSVVVQGAAWRKNGLFGANAQDDWDLREGQQPFRPNPNRVWDLIIMLRRVLICAVQFCSLYILYCIYDRNFALHYRERLEQGWAFYGSREYFVRRANTFETLVNLSYDVERGNKCRMKEPKSLHVTIK